jgi:bacteriocin biosynthesis cyclodehydratase domain-containing protein
VQKAEIWQLKRPLIPLWLGNDYIRLGVEADAVFEQVPEALKGPLLLLNRPQTENSLVRLTPELDRKWIRWLLGQLDAGGLLCHGRPTATTAVRVIGRGRLAEDIMSGLSQAGVPCLPRSARLPDVGFAVLATGTMEPDRLLVRDLRMAGIPHMPVRIWPGRARVGPLVNPGRTACLRCLDMARSATDREWAHVLPQLCSLSQRATPPLLAWAVATAVLQVQAYCRGTTADAVSRVLELDGAENRFSVEEIRPHPYCNCVENGDEYAATWIPW